MVAKRLKSLTVYLVSLLCCLSVVAAGAGQEETPIPEPPALTRPRFFTGGVGVFVISTKVDSPTVQVDRPFRLTVRIEGIGKVHRAPGRIDLTKIPEFQKNFHPPEIPTPGESRPAENVWEFYYLLKPRSLAVTEVPEVPFDYFNPALSPNYSRERSEFIPLKVTPAEIVKPAEVQGGDELLRVPESVLIQAEGEEVLQPHRQWELPGLEVVLPALLGPPLACWVWLLIWQRLYPDAARKARQRRSRAARQALKAVASLPPAAEKEQGEQLAGIVTQFLEQRLELTVKTPTPHEVAAHFQRLEAPESLTQHAVEFYEACDAARYSSAETVSRDELSASATRLILAVEEHAWSSHTW